MIRYWLLLILLGGIMGCQNVHQPRKPKNLISKDKMADILTQAYLANAARSVDNKSITERGIEMDSLIYIRFGVDSLQFARSNAYYSANVNAYIEIFQNVEKRLVIVEKTLDSLREIQRKKDSIQGIIPEEREVVEPVKDSLI